MTLIIEAGSGLKTFLFLCRFRYDSPLGPVVAFRGDYCIRFRDLLCALAVLVQFIALAAGPIFDVAGFGTCRIYRFRLLKRMALCSYYCIRCRDLCCSLIITKQLFAYAAGPVLGIAGFSAGCILRFGLLKRMALCSYYCIRCRDLCCSLIITEQLLALTAGPVLGIACLGARCIFRFRLIKRMALRGYYCLGFCSHSLQVQYSMFPASVQVASFASVLIRS